MNHINHGKTSECGLPNDRFGRLTSVTLVLIIKNKSYIKIMHKKLIYKK